MNTNLIILAAGASSRMKNSTAEHLSEEKRKEANTASKGLIGIGKENRPLLDYLLLNAKKAGYKTITMVVGAEASSFKRHFGEQDEGNFYNGLTVSYATQFIPKGRIKPFGTADALFQALEQYPKLQSGSFIVCNSDNLYSVAALKALRETPEKNALIAYDRAGLEFTAERIASFALLRLDEDYRLLDIIEKPSEIDADQYTDRQGTLRVSMNIFKFDGAEIYPFLQNCPVHPTRNEKELPTAVMHLSKSNGKHIKGIPFNEHVPDLTSKEDILKVAHYIGRYLSD
jgi:glucose-1-phosphate adenylyltransferase